jgi:hypothetical protein
MTDSGVAGGVNPLPALGHCTLVSPALPLLQVLFDGRSELDQITRIFSLLGSPNEKIWPGLSKLPAASKVCPSTACALRMQQHAQWGVMMRQHCGAAGNREIWHQT